jgi:hypothetical protein
MDRADLEMYPQSATYWHKAATGTWERHAIPYCRIAAVRGADKSAPPHAGLSDTVRLLVPCPYAIDYREADRFVEGSVGDLEPPKPPAAHVVTSVYASHLVGGIDHYEIGGS